MKKEKKVKYEAPTLEVVFVELEQGIAASSTTVSPGTGAGADPEVTPWTGGTDLGSQNGDL